MEEPKIILLVEDDAPVRRLISEWLRRSGYEVLEASSGADAIRASTENDGHISLLLTDIDLAKGISGIELAERLEGISPDLRVVIMSGSPEHSAAFQGTRRFVSKPFAPGDLLSKIEEVLGFAASAAHGRETRVAVDRRHST